MTQMTLLWQIGFGVDTDFSRPYDEFRDEYTAVAYGTYSYDLPGGSAEHKVAIERLCETLFADANVGDLRDRLPRSMSVGDCIVLTSEHYGHNHLSIPETNGWRHTLLLKSRWSGE